MRMPVPTKVMSVLLIDAPEPHRIFGVNDRYIRECDFDGGSSLFACNHYTMETTEYHAGDGFQYTGGSVRLFKTKEGAIIDAYNTQVRNLISRAEILKKSLKEAQS